MMHRMDQNMFRMYSHICTHCVWCFLRSTNIQYSGKGVNGKHMENMKGFKDKCVQIYKFGDIYLERKRERGRGRRRKGCDKNIMKESWVQPSQDGDHNRHSLS
jgi:hypothetical protein